MNNLSNLRALRKQLNTIVREFPSCPFEEPFDLIEVDIDSSSGIREEIAVECGVAPFERRDFPIPELWDAITDVERAPFGEYADWAEHCRSVYIENGRAIVAEIDAFLEEREPAPADPSAPVVVGSGWGGRRPGSGRKPEIKRYTPVIRYPLWTLPAIDAIAPPDQYPYEWIQQLVLDRLRAAFPPQAIGQLIVVFFPEGSAMRKAHKTYNRTIANRKENGQTGLRNEEQEFYNRALLLFPRKALIAAAERYKPGQFIQWNPGELDELREEFRLTIEANGWNAMTITPRLASIKGGIADAVIQR